MRTLVALGRPLADDYSSAVDRWGTAHPGATRWVGVPSPLIMNLSAFPPVDHGLRRAFRGETDSNSMINAASRGNDPLEHSA